MSRYNLKYRTFNQLIDSVSTDFRAYELEGMINPEDLIKVAMKINSELGLRIAQTKNAVIEINNYKAKLPSDFHILKTAFACYNEEWLDIPPQGTFTEDVHLNLQVPVFNGGGDPNILNCSEPPKPIEIDGCNKCGSEKVLNSCITCADKEQKGCAVDCRGDEYKLVQYIRGHKRTFKQMLPLRVNNNPKFVDCECPNVNYNCSNSITIKDGWIYASFKSGNIMVVYDGAMENEEGELMVIDHPMINEYYEYALKRRILENLIMNREQVNQAQIQLIEARTREARIEATTVVYTPEFSELTNIWKRNRKKHIRQFYDIISRPR